MEFTGKGSETTQGIPERLLAAEVFQVLRCGIDTTGYEIQRGKYQQGDRPDFVIQDDSGSRRYLVEMKIARHGIEGLRSQVARYNSSFSKAKRNYALILVENNSDLPKNNHRIRHELSQVEDLSSTEYILKEPSDFRYEIS